MTRRRIQAANSFSPGEVRAMLQLFRAIARQDVAGARCVLTGKVGSRLYAKWLAMAERIAAQEIDQR